MKTLSSDFQEHLDSGATTLCTCWKIERADGLILGFTDHDRAIQFDDVHFLPNSGLSASETVTTLGLAADTDEVEGALTNATISDKDIAQGAYDGALVVSYVVNWQVPEQRTQKATNEIGEITRQDGVFRAELRGLSYRLNQKQGRLFEQSCDAHLGDERCQKNISGEAFTIAAAVTQFRGRQVIVIDKGEQKPAGWFDRGHLVWTSGANEGRTVQVNSTQLEAGALQVNLWVEVTYEIAIGDELTLTAGCDKQFASCKSKFGNARNFQGFPHIPGNDFIFQSAKAGGQNNGNPVV